MLSRGIKTALGGFAAFAALGLSSCVTPTDDVEPMAGASPLELVGSTLLDGAPARELVLRGPLAFVACGGRGVKIVDVSRPDLPAVIATIDAVADSIAVTGDTLYALDVPSGWSSKATLSVFDVLDPHAAELVKTVTLDAGAIGDFAAEDHFLVVAAGTAGMKVADGRQILFTSRPTPGGKERADAVLLRRGVLFALGGPKDTWLGDDSGAGTIEMTNLDRNASLATIALDAPNALGPRPAVLDGIEGPSGRSLCLDGDRLLVATGDRLLTFDVRDAKQPKPLGSLDLPNAFRVATDGTFAACATGDLALVDLNDFAAPRLITEVPTPGVVLDVQVRGRLVFVAAGDAGLRVYQVTEPAASQP